MNATRRMYGRDASLSASIGAPSTALQSAVSLGEARNFRRWGLALTQRHHREGLAEVAPMGSRPHLKYRSFRFRDKRAAFTDFRLSGFLPVFPVGLRARVEGSISLRGPCANSVVGALFPSSWETCARDARGHLAGDFVDADAGSSHLLVHCESLRNFQSKDHSSTSLIWIQHIVN